MFSTMFRYKLAILVMMSAIGNFCLAGSHLGLRKEPSRKDREQALNLRPHQLSFCSSPRSGRCLGSLDPWTQCEAPGKEGRLQQKALASSVTRFGIEAYAMVASERPGENVAISPVSLVSALSLLLLGSRNKTHQILQESLYYGQDLTCVHRTLHHLLHASKNLVSASQIFYREGVCLEQTFVNRSMKYYRSKPFPLTSDSRDNTRMVNKWVSRSTGNLITRLVDQVPSETILMLLNAVRYTGQWKTKFDRGHTINKNFWVTKNRTVSVPMLYSTSYPLTVLYDHFLKVQAAKIPLFGMNSFIILLPNGRTLKQIESSLDNKTMVRLVERLDQMNVAPTAVLLPRINIDFSQNLLGPFRKMGLQEALLNPNLCGLTRGEDLSITSATHRVVLSLNEEGVEASAVTSLTVGRSMLSFEVIHPFIWILWDNKQGYPLFMGRMVDPSR